MLNEIYDGYLAKRGDFCNKVYPLSKNLTMLQQKRHIKILKNPKQFLSKYKNFNLKLICSGKNNFLS